MSNKSGLTEQVLPLPKGGGALAGIGETFSPDLHTGTGNFSIPIASPPGRSGFGPNLSLNYSTGSPNGPYGLGWSLSVPGITRKTEKGLPTYDDASDVFVLSGAEDLVRVPGAPAGRTRFRPRTEGLFARIEHLSSTAGNYWEVRSKDGLVSTYGTPRPSGAGADWRDPAAVADPANAAHIFAWKLTRTTDTFGNEITYSYQRDLTRSDGPHRWDQLYLSEVRYADYGDPSDPQFLLSVKFRYEGRPDPFSHYRPGFEVRTIQRCSRVEVWTQADGDLLTRTYHLLYLDQMDGNANRLPRNGVSLLARFHVTGHDDSIPNLLSNPSFADIGSDGPTTRFTTPGPGASSSAADGWRLWSDVPATIETEVRPSTCPLAPNGLLASMIRVSTTARACGFVHRFGATNRGPGPLPPRRGST